jgi:hypothetical protein
MWKRLDGWRLLWASEKVFCPSMDAWWRKNDSMGRDIFLAAQKIDHRGAICKGGIVKNAQRTF